MGIWKNVSQQLGGLAKHVAKTVVQEPVEIIENAVGQQNDNKAMEAVEQGSQGQQQNTQQAVPGDSGANGGFKTQQDFQKYQQLSGRKDEMEIAILRRKLFQENSLNVDVESGMQKARMEYEEKEKQRNQVEEQKKQEEKWVVEQKKKEDMSVKAATESASAENKAWGAG